MPMRSSKQLSAMRSTVRATLTPVPARRGTRTALPAIHQAAVPEQSARPAAIQTSEKQLLWKKQIHWASATDASHLQCVGCYRLIGPATLYKVDEHQLEAHLLPGARVEILNRDQAVVFSYDDLLDMAHYRCGSYWQDVDNDRASGGGSVSVSSMCGTERRDDEREEANCLLIGACMQLEGPFEASHGATPLVHGDMTVLQVHSWGDADSISLLADGRVSHPVNMCPPDDEQQQLDTQQQQLQQQQEARRTASML